MRHKHHRLKWIRDINCSWLWLMMTIMVMVRVFFDKWWWRQGAAKQMSWWCVGCSEIICQLWSCIIALVLYRIRAGCNLQCINHRRATTKKRSGKNIQRHKLLCAPAAAIKTTRIFVVNQASRGGQLGSSAIISMCHVMRQCFLCWSFLDERPNFQHFRVVYIICSAKDSQKNS